MSNVIPITIKPNTECEQYRRHTITLSFLPASSKWQWRIDFQVTHPITGEGRTKNDALAKAKRKLDQLLEA